MPLMVDVYLSIGTPEALWLGFDGRRRRFAPTTAPRHGSLVAVRYSGRTKWILRRTRSARKPPR